MKPMSPYTECPMCRGSWPAKDTCDTCLGHGVVRIEPCISPSPPPDRALDRCRRPTTPESRLLQDVRLALGREPDLVLWRIQPGGIHDSTGRPIHTAPTGIADLCGVLAPHGRWFCLELKSQRGRTTPEQEQWGRLLIARGGFYAVVKTVAEAVAALSRARGGASC